MLQEHVQNPLTSEIGAAPQASTKPLFEVKPYPTNVKIGDPESEWSDMEEDKQPNKGNLHSAGGVAVVVAEMGEEGLPGGEIVSKNEVKLKPFDKPESIEEREKR